MVWTDDPNGPAEDIIPQKSTVDLGSTQSPFQSVHTENLYATNATIDTATINNLTVPTFAIKTSQAIPGGYNLLDGMVEWRLGTAYADGRRDLTGNGGVDVVFLGDSIFAGAGASYIYTDCITNRLRQFLQRKFNPLDIVGGYGFLAWGQQPPTPGYVGATFSGNMYVNDADTDWGFYGLPNAYVGELGDSLGICRRHYRIASTLAGPTQTAAWISFASQRFNSQYQLTTAAQGLTAKQVQIVYSSNPGDGTFQWIHGNFSATTPPYDGTPPTPPANTFSETVDCDAAVAVGLRTDYSDVATETNATFYVQVDQLEPNNGITIEGWLHYVDDVAKGVRVHNLCVGGADSTTYNDPVTLAGLARFGSRSGTIPGQNAQNAKLVIIELGTNDCGTGAAPIIDVATYKANLTTLIESIQTWTSDPSILLVYPPVRNNANALARWQDYIDAGKELADSHNVAVLDLWAAVNDVAHGGAAPGGFWFDRGMYNDGVHYNEKGQDFFAHSLFGALTEGV